MERSPTVALLPHFSSQIYKIDFGTARLNYGANKVGVLSPVNAGSTLAATIIAGVRPDRQGAFITIQYTVTAHGP